MAGALLHAVARFPSELPLSVAYAIKTSGYLALVSVTASWEAANVVSLQQRATMRAWSNGHSCNIACF
jgi:hypothetical protein